MAELQLQTILDALSDNPTKPLDAPDSPGLYAIWGNASVWKELGLGEPPDGRPLYVGKAEESLLKRDVRQHFGTGKTGSSTVRRSVAALLKSGDGYTGMPRNPKKPSHFPMYAVPNDQCEKLTAWMLANLRLGTWAPDEPVNLDAWETKVLAYWQPPMNLSKLKTPWTQKLKTLRKSMAEEARGWRPIER